MTRTSADTNPPAKVNGLKSTNLGSNLVELEWDANNEQDFEQYVIYRAILAQ